MAQIPANPSVDVKGLKPFKRFIMTIGNLPTSYLESLTYAELVMWFCNFLQEQVIPAVNNNGGAVEELQALYVELKNYVDNYFTDLDVQEEINNKLDEMVESGQFEQIIEIYLQTQKIYNTYTELINDANNFQNGQRLQTLGYYDINDGGGNFYYVSSADNLKGYKISLGNNLYLYTILTDTKINVKQFGAYGDNVHDDSDAFQNAFDYILNSQYNSNTGIDIYTGYTYELYIPTGIYILNNQINCKGSYLHIKGERAILKPTHNENIFNFTGSSGWNCIIENITFYKGNNAIYFNSSNLEMGNTHIINCWFYQQTSHAIYIHKNSQIFIAEKCKFFKPYYVAELLGVDKATIKECWISEAPRLLDKDACIIHRSNRLLIENNLFVPYYTQYSESAYINAYNSVQCINNHFGGENGQKTIINVMDTFVQPGNESINPLVSFVEIKNSDNMYTYYGSTAIRLFALPMNLIINGNLGFIPNAKIIDWGLNVDTDTALTNNKGYLQIDIALNNGYAIKNSNITNLMPANLRPFLYDYKKYVENQSVITNKTDKISNTQYRIPTNIKAMTQAVNQPMLLQLNLFSEGTSYNYRSQIIGLINFIIYYGNNNVKLKVYFTPLFNKSGGFTENYNKEENINITFEDTGTDEINLGSTGNFPNTMNLLVTTTKNISNFKIKTLMEGTNIYGI